MARSENLSELRKLARPAVVAAAIEAVKAGQAVIEAGLQSRAPVRTHALRNSIHSTAVGVGKTSVGGFVVVGTDHALAVEYGPHPRPFIRPTLAADGPKAEAAMMAKMRSKLGG